MKHLKTLNELFGFGSKKPKTWKDKFQEIYNFYLKNKDKKDINALDIPRADVKDDSLSISQGFDNHLVFYGKTKEKSNRNMELVDFSEADYSDPKSTKGVYPITQAEYDEYKEKIQEISDWLDDRSEKEFGKSNTGISDSGELSMDFNEGDVALDELGEKVKSELKIIGQKYEFEMSYHLWTSNSSNKLVVERRELPINDLKFEFGGGRFWCQLFTVDPFGVKAGIWLESDSSSEYYDFDSHKWPYHGDKDKIISMNSIKKEMTRKEEREFEKNRKYPYAFSYDITPCKYNSIQLIKEITDILQQMNMGLKKN
jgi:hypothetical protein